MPKRDQILPVAYLALDTRSILIIMLKLIKSLGMGLNIYTSTKDRKLNLEAIFDPRVKHLLRYGHQDFIDDNAQFLSKHQQKA